MWGVSHWTNERITVQVPAFLQEYSRLWNVFLEVWLQSKLHVLNKGCKKCELGDSCQNTGWKHPRNSWRMLGQSFVFEDASGQLEHMFASVYRHLRYGPPAACTMSAVPEARSHCGYILPSLWIWTMRLNKLCALDSLFTLLNLSKCNIPCCLG